MDTYYVEFYSNDKEVAGVWKEASSRELACIYARAHMLKIFPNIRFNNCKILAIIEGMEG